MKGSALSCSGYVKRLCRSTRASSGWAKSAPPAVPKATRKSHCEWERTRVLLICEKLVERI